MSDSLAALLRLDADLDAIGAREPVLADDCLLAALAVFAEGLDSAPMRPLPDVYAVSCTLRPRPSRLRRGSWVISGTAALMAMSTGMAAAMCSDPLAPVREVVHEVGALAHHDSGHVPGWSLSGGARIDYVRSAVAVSTADAAVAGVQPRDRRNGDRHSGAGHAGSQSHNGHGGNPARPSQPPPPVQPKPPVSPRHGHHGGSPVRNNPTNGGGSPGSPGSHGPSNTGHGPGMVETPPPPRPTPPGVPGVPTSPRTPANPTSPGNAAQPRNVSPGVPTQPTAPTQPATPAAPTRPTPGGAPAPEPTVAPIP